MFKSWEPSRRVSCCEHEHCAVWNSNASKGLTLVWAYLYSGKAILSITNRKGIIRSALQNTCIQDSPHSPTKIRKCLPFVQNGEKPTATLSRNGSPFKRQYRSTIYADSIMWLYPEYTYHIAAYCLPIVFFFSVALFFPFHNRMSLFANKTFANKTCKAFTENSITRNELLSNWFGN